MRGSSPLDHLPIIEAIAKHLNFKELQSLILVSRKCARFFKESGWINGRIDELRWIRKNPSFHTRKYKDNELYCIEILRIRPWLIELMEQTDKICLEAVKQNGFALQYVEHQTYEICQAAVTNEKGASKYIRIKMNRKRKWVFILFYLILVVKLVYLSLLIL
jgi:hypothetical protein